MTFASASQFHIYFYCGTSNQEKTLIGISPLYILKLEGSMGALLTTTGSVGGRGIGPRGLAAACFKLFRSILFSCWGINQRSANSNRVFSHFTV